MMVARYLVWAVRDFQHCVGSAFVHGSLQGSFKGLGFKGLGFKGLGFRV